VPPLGHVGQAHDDRFRSIPVSLTHAPPPCAFLPEHAARIPPLITTTATRAQIEPPTRRRDRLGAAVLASTMAATIRRKSAPHEAQDAVSVNRSKPQFGQNFIAHLVAESS
jgi:hypothetical protein